MSSRAADIDRSFVVNDRLYAAPNRQRRHLTAASERVYRNLGSQLFICTLIFSHAALRRATVSYCGVRGIGRRFARRRCCCCFTYFGQAVRANTHSLNYSVVRRLAAGVGRAGPHAGGVDGGPTPVTEPCHHTTIPSCTDRCKSWTRIHLATTRGSAVRDVIIIINVLYFPYVTYRRY